MIKGEFNLETTPLEGTNLIEASAGTGKTFTIAGIYLRLIVEKKFSIDQILVVTFTVAATEELRRRIRNKIRMAVAAFDGEEGADDFVMSLMEKYSGDRSVRSRLMAALKSFDEASVYTIHSFCQQVLVDNAFESGSLFNMELTRDSAMLPGSIVRDFWRRKLYNAEPEVAEIIMGMRSPEDWLKLCLKKPLDPSVSIEPGQDEPDPAVLHKLHSDLEKLFRKLQNMWAAGREEVCEILMNSPALSAKSYSRKDGKMEGVISDMDTYTGSGEALSLFEKFHLFTSGKISGSVKKDYDPPSHPVFDICQKIEDTSAKISEFGTSMVLYFEHELLDFMDSELIKRKERTGVRSFDDLIRDVHAASGSGPGLAENMGNRYRAALIDEFQDTDQLQFDIFSSMFAGGDSVLFLIGDPKQAIYRFRGADIFSYIRASKMMKNRYTLNRNWRSTPALIDAVNSLFGNCENPFLSEDISYPAVRAGDDSQSCTFSDSGRNRSGISIYLADDSAGTSSPLKKEEALSLIINSLCSEISRITSPGGKGTFLGEKRTEPGDIAVLVRTHRHADLVQSSLRSLNIPSVIQGGQTIFSTDEARELYFILCAIAEPLNDRYLKTALSTHLMGYKGEAIARIFSGHEENSGSDTAAEISDEFFRFRELWLTRGVMDMLNRFIAERGITERVFSMGSGDRRATNIFHLAEILHRSEKENRFSAGELTAWLRSCISEGPDDEEYLLRLERDEQAVKIITMHASKGLEFPVVFCPMIAEQQPRLKGAFVYHDPEREGRPVMYLRTDSVPDEVSSLYRQEDLAENLRLMYVALTRAKSACYIYTANGTSFQKSALYHIFSKGKGVHSKTPDTGDVIKMLEAAAEESGGSITFSMCGNEHGAAARDSADDISELRCREFAGPDWKAWRIWSYSSLVRPSSREERDTDRFTLTSFPEPEGEENIFSFPAGAAAGTCIHEIFENIDFTRAGGDEFMETISRICGARGFDESWAPHLNEMLNRVLTTPLSSSGPVLSDIDLPSRLNELEFYFPVAEAGMPELRRILKEDRDYGNFLEKSPAGESGLNGLMKGFIDLVFESEGKFYIIDWKSNLLGRDFTDYGLDRINQEMASHNYYLQYYIYTVALHRYLRLRMGNSYSYEKNFGGVFYLFVRGVGISETGRSGIFSHKPDEEVIMKLDSLFAGRN